MADEVEERKREFCAMKAAWNAVIDKTGAIKSNKRIFRDCIASNKKPVISRYEIDPFSRLRKN